MAHERPGEGAQQMACNNRFKSRCSYGLPLGVGRSAQQYGGFGDKPSGEGVGGLPEPGVAGVGEGAAPY